MKMSATFIVLANRPSPETWLIFDKEHQRNICNIENFNEAAN